MRDAWGKSHWPRINSSKYNRTYDYQKSNCKKINK
uniref:Uncharacterized protein n=1 Tax=Rhizophora mucronata TaxID=61149 RepID=A0A2P2NHQ0_RHIMU